MARLPMSLALVAAGLLPFETLASVQPIVADTILAARTLKTRFTYKTSVPSIPSGTKQVRLWLPIPSDGPYQTVSNVKVASPSSHRITTESKFGNRMVFVEAQNPGSSLDVSVSFDVERKEATPLAGGGGHDGDDDLSGYLKPDALVPIGGRYAEIARGVVGNKATTLDKMRAIYEHTVANMQYDYKKESPKLGMGDVAFVCDYKKGNCSDLHSYVISLARSVGVPSYLEFGFPVCGIPVPGAVPAKGTVGGYHCWAWFHDDEKGWLPLDASDGRRWLDSNRPDVKAKLVGSLVLERSAVALSKGRDIVLEPPQKAEALNNFIYPYAEADGSSVEAKWVMEYELLSPAGTVAAPSGSVEDQLVELRKLVLTQQDEIGKLRSELNAKNIQLPPNVTATTTSTKQKATIYGFVRTDVIHDSQQPNPNNQFPFFINSPDTAGIGSNNERFALHPRLTRVGIDLADTGGTLRGWQTSGKIELDFQGGGSESRATPRLRHAFVQVRRPGLAVLAGQTSDLISPLFPSPNDDSLMWNAGNLGDRRPQIRVTFDQPGQPFSVAIGLGLTGAIDAKDLDANGIRDGEESGVPNLQVRAAWASPKGTVGVWGHAAKEHTTAAVAGQNSFTSTSLGADLKLQLTSAVDLSGEIWSGQNLSDFRGGVGQGVNTTTGNEIESRGGWIELGYKTSPKHRIAAGYTVDDPDDGDVPASGRTKNFAWFLHNKFSLSEALDLGINLLGWTTEFKGLRTGRDTRFNVFLSYKY